MLNSKAKTMALPDRSPQRLTALLATLAILALALAWLALPQLARAQGIVRGAEEGAHEGHRVAGPVGGVVGGAVGAGVGETNKGVFVVLHLFWRHCRGYRDVYGQFHCYR